MRPDFITLKNIDDKNSRTPEGSTTFSFVVLKLYSGSNSRKDRNKQFHSNNKDRGT